MIKREEWRGKYYQRGIRERKEISYQPTNAEVQCLSGGECLLGTSQCNVFSIFAWSIFFFFFVVVVVFRFLNGSEGHDIEWPKAQYVD